MAFFALIRWFCIENNTLVKIPIGLLFTLVPLYIKNTLPFIVSHCWLEQITNVGGKSIVSFLDYKLHFSTQILNWHFSENKHMYASCAWLYFSSYQEILFKPQNNIETEGGFGGGAAGYGLLSKLEFIFLVFQRYQSN